MTAAKFGVLQHVMTLVKCLAAEDPAVQAMWEKLAPYFASPIVFNRHFPVTPPAGGVPPGEDVEDAAEPAEGDPGVESGGKDEGGVAPDPLGDLAKTLTRTGVCLAELLHSIYAGDYDGDLKRLASYPQPLLALQTEPEHLGELGSRLRELMRVASSATLVVGAGSVGAPALSLRTLARINS